MMKEFWGTAFFLYALLCTVAMSLFLATTAAGYLMYHLRWVPR